MSLVEKYERDPNMSFDEICDAAQERWDYASCVAHERVQQIRQERSEVSEHGIVSRTERSRAYTDNFPHTNEVNDYFLIKSGGEPENLPASVRSFYGIEIEGVQK